MTKILITGGAGFIAPHIIEESINKLKFIRLITEVPENLKFKEAKYLLKDVRDLETDLENDYVAHLAFINIPNSIKFPR